MRSNLLLTVIFFSLTAFQQSKAQTSCSPEDLLGNWKETLTLPGTRTSFDSLKIMASASSRTLGIWNFTDDKRYTYRHALQRSKYKRKGVYHLDAPTCEIILGTKPNARERANLEILYLDKTHLIYKSDNNPKGYFTHVLTRYEKKSRKK